MSSVTSESLSRPKSPVLEQPGRMRSARTAESTDGGVRSRRWRARGDIAEAESAAPQPAAAAVVRRRVAVGLGLFGLRIGVPLDPDHGKDDDRCGFIRRVTAEAHNAPLVREFDDVTHQPLSSAAGKEAFCPAARKSASP